jgi:hypothetical protein
MGRAALATRPAFRYPVAGNVTAALKVYNSLAAAREGFAANAGQSQSAAIR